MRQLAAWRWLTTTNERVTLGCTNHREMGAITHKLSPSTHKHSLLSQYAPLLCWFTIASEGGGSGWQHFHSGFMSVGFFSFFFSFQLVRDRKKGVKEGLKASRMRRKRLKRRERDLWELIGLNVWVTWASWVGCLCHRGTQLQYSNTAQRHVL